MLQVVVSKVSYSIEAKSPFLITWDMPDGLKEKQVLLVPSFATRARIRRLRIDAISASDRVGSEPERGNQVVPCQRQ
jgi:hypothetical protein